MTAVELEPITLRESHADSAETRVDYASYSLAQQRDDVDAAMSSTVDETEKSDNAPEQSTKMHRSEMTETPWMWRYIRCVCPGGRLLDGYRSGVFSYSNVFLILVLFVSADQHQNSIHATTAIKQI